MKQHYRGSILIVENDQALSEALQDTLELAGYWVSTAVDGFTALEQLAEHPVGLVLSDVHMDRMDGEALLQRVRQTLPEIPVLLMTAYATIERAVAAMRLGAVDYLVKPFAAEQMLASVERHIRSIEPTQDSHVVAKDPKSVALLALASRVAASSATVMLGGESGSGKEVIARYIHRHSPRAAQPFIAINCAAIPETMLEATLFGYEKGAFTGAQRATPGKFEQANGGTLLLDEISEMDLTLQAKLLRVLQEQEVERLGAQRTIPLDVRVIATSNRQLREEVAAGRFREDLYYRLNVFPLRLLPLRERPADIIPLAQQILARIALDSRASVKKLTLEAVHALQGYRWPGNVRELDNVMQRAMILTIGEQITVESLQLESLDPLSLPVHRTDLDAVVAVPMEGVEDLQQGMQQQEYHLIREALRLGSRKASAALLGISERTLRYKIARLRDAGLALD